MATRTADPAMIEKRRKAVSHPTRAAALRILYERAASPAEIARELDEDVSMVSYHVKSLVALDCAQFLYASKKNGRAVEHVYKATEHNLISTEEWQHLLATNPHHADHLVAEYGQAIVDDLATGVAIGISADENWHITRTPLLVDREGLAKQLEIAERARLEMLDVQDEALERGGQTFRVSSSLAVFRLAEYPDSQER